MSSLSAVEDFEKYRQQFVRALNAEILCLERKQYLFQWFDLVPEATQSAFLTEWADLSHRLQFIRAHKELLEIHYLTARKALGAQLRSFSSNSTQVSMDSPPQGPVKRPAEIETDGRRVRRKSAPPSFFFESAYPKGTPIIYKKQSGTIESFNKETNLFTVHLENYTVLAGRKELVLDPTPNRPYLIFHQTFYSWGTIRVCNNNTRTLLVEIQWETNFGQSRYKRIADLGAVLPVAKGDPLPEGLSERDMPGKYYKVPTFT